MEMPMQELEAETEGALSIGALSRATGISIHSLRMWERRYGAPVSMRRSSGHRRYSPDEVPRLRAVARALASGLRAGTVVPATIEAIDDMLNSGLGGAAIEANSSVVIRLREMMTAARELDEASLGRILEEDWRALGPLRFMEDRGVPFMRDLGEEWKCGSLGVAQEHFASERLSDFLAAKWRALNREAAGAPFVLATLPNDLHRMGLLMAAVSTTVAGRRVVFLGSGVPVEEIAQSAQIAKAAAVCVGVSGATPPRLANTAARQLLDLLPKRVSVVFGGAVAGQIRVEKVQIFREIASYAAWVGQLTP